MSKGTGQAPKRRTDEGRVEPSDGIRTRNRWRVTLADENGQTSVHEFACYWSHSYEGVDQMVGEAACAIEIARLKQVRVLISQERIAA